MDIETSIQDAVRELLRSRAPHRLFADLPDDLPDDLRLGPGGLGLDSIAVVELLLDCERRLGVPPMGLLGLLDGAPLTVGRLVAGLRLHLEMTL
jgi:acyl carrier protein